MTLDLTKCLLVDDDPDTLHLLRKFLRIHLPTWEISSETRPARALAGLRALRPDVIISDLRMPEMDGIEFLRRAREEVPQARRLLVTGFGSSAAEELAREHPEIDVVLMKPIETIPFIQRLRMLAAGRPEAKS